MRRPKYRPLIAPNPYVRWCQGFPCVKRLSTSATVSVITMCALNVASGKVITKMTNAHRAIEFIEFLEIIDKNVPKELGVHVVLDNYAAHKTESVRMWLLAHPRFQFHFTPTYSSWMNQVERWFSALTTKYLQRSVHHSVTELNEGITEWAEAWNKNPKPFIWTKSADEIFASMQKYLGPSVSEQTSD
ncbi:IS630 family transposase [Ferrimicrobium acidiphilum]|uniref:IS630 family transposase n=1 Tax=Ferrimicrobium acidiphilum TaxID=121039 RepID=UPI0023F0BD98